MLQPLIGLEHVGKGKVKQLNGTGYLFDNRDVVFVRPNNGDIQLVSQPACTRAVIGMAMRDKDFFQDDIER